MAAKNIFEGDSYVAQIAKVIYDQLMSGQEVTYTSVLKAYKIHKVVPDKVSADEYYSCTKKAFMNVLGELKTKIPDCIEETSDKRRKIYKYVGEDKEPLKDLQNAATISDLKTYFNFCQDSAGLMPLCWLEHFFKNTHDLIEIKKRKSSHRQIIVPDYHRLRNIEYLPKIYEYIRRKEPFHITYRLYTEEERQWIVHPHYLHEYKGRWYVLGYVEEHGYDKIYVIPLDRIESDLEPTPGVSYKPANMEPYEKFEHIIGVTYLADSPIYTIHLRIYDKIVWGLMKTKPLHKSQQSIMDFDDGKGYGEITLEVALNMELESSIMGYGDHIEVLAPKELQDRMRQRIIDMCQRNHIDVQ